MPNEAVTTAIAVRDETSAVMLTNAQLQMIANTSFVPAAFRGKVPEVLACVATGRALGLPDMTSLRGIHVIEGKATLSAELMVAIVRGHGHSITGTVNRDKAVAKGKRADNGDEMTAEFTREMATEAGLAGKSNWKKHPDDMMWARAVSKLCRRLFADCFAGATYVPEEVEPTADELLDESVPFDSGPLPESEEHAAQLGFGELTEPGGDTAPSHAAASISQPGSVSSWADLKTAGATIGLSPDELRGRAKIEFMGRTASDVTAREWNLFWLSLLEESRADEREDAQTRIGANG